MDLIIRGGKIFNGFESFSADIGIKHGKISLIGTRLEVDSKTKLIDATGLYVFPGIIDAHTHYSLPMRNTVSSDTFETGTRSAAAGGVTTIIDFATQNVDQSLIDAINNRKVEADNEVYVDYSLHGGITNWNEQRKKEVEQAIDSGISSFKMFMAYRRRGLWSSDSDIVDALEVTTKLGGLIQVHAEADDLLETLTEKYHTKKMMDKHGIYCHVLARPNVIEAEAVQRAITWSEYTKGSLYIVHMSTKEATNFVRVAKKKRMNVISETCPQYLLLNDEVFKRENGYYYATAPQVKKEEDNQYLWKSVEDGIIDVIATDSCTFNTNQKKMWDNDFTKIPLGMPGTELMLSLIYSEGVDKKRISTNQLVRLMSVNPAKIYGLYPEKGSLHVGTDADITIFDPKKQWNVDYRKMETNCDWNPYNDWKLVGKPIYTIVRGEVVAENGRCIGEKGFGRFIKRGHSGPIRD